METIWWHPMYHTDPARLWLGDLFRLSGIEIR
jgi:hypothetical protein